MVQDRPNMVELCGYTWGWDKRIEEAGENFSRQSLKKDQALPKMHKREHRQVSPKPMSLNASIPVKLERPSDYTSAISILAPKFVFPRAE